VEWDERRELDVSGQRRLGRKNCLRRRRLRRVRSARDAPRSWTFARTRSSARSTSSRTNGGVPRGPWARSAHPRRRVPR